MSNVNHNDYSFESVATQAIKDGFKVFPIQELQKAPPLVPFKTAATDNLKQVKKWAKQFPQANVGIHCEDLIVIDVDDSEGKNGWITFEKLKDEIKLKPTYIVETPRSGGHFYYTFPGGVGNSVNSIGSGIDIRTNGGYVLAAGSQIYVENELTGTKELKEYKRDGDVTITDAPNELIEKCKTKKSPKHQMNLTMF